MREILEIFNPKNPLSNRKIEDVVLNNSEDKAVESQILHYSLLVEYLLTLLPHYSMSRDDPRVFGRLVTHKESQPTYDLVLSALNLKWRQKPSLRFVLPISKTSYGEGIIKLPREGRGRAIPSLAHEYTHYIQDRMWEINSEMYKSVYTSWCEGQAIVMEHHVAFSRAISEVNPLFLWSTINASLARLQSFSRFLWGTHKSVLGTKPFDEFGELEELRPSRHAFGFVYALMQSSLLHEKVREYNQNFLPRRECKQ